jgi:parallel beta-helix repeat protein
METIQPSDGMEIRKSCRLAEGTYLVPNGITIAAPGITIEGAGTRLYGVGGSGTGIRLSGVDGVTLRGVHLSGYEHGIRARDLSGLTIDGCTISATAEVAPNTVFLDIWRKADNAYGGAILLDRVRDATVDSCLMQHQQNGLLTYGCSGLAVTRNHASYNSGFGFHLFGTCESRFEDNCADYCCRFEPREGGLHYGHMGADAAGFLAVCGSSRNVFRRNAARLGGDGFFLAGLSPDGTPCGCNDNLFEANDGSLSPNIAFEATFCRGNVFRDNYADRSNYGFWLGFSWDTTLEGDRMVMNRQAGIAVENGHGFRILDNTFQANGHGILLWSVFVEQFAQAFPDSLTSYDWQIEHNVMTRNGKGVRIAADQDHGIRPAPADRSGRPETRPRGHRIIGNDIQDNRIGIELVRCDGTVIERNILNRNVEANVRQDDAQDTLVRNNLGSAGGYL